MKAPAPLLNALQSILQQALRLDPESRPCFAALEGRVILLRLDAPAFTIYLLPQHSGILLMDDWETVPDAEIQGGVLSLLRLFTKPDESLLESGIITLCGDSAVARQFIECFQALEIDWEEQSAKLVGDTPARKIGRFLRDGTAWGQRSAAVLEQNVVEYLREEARFLPPREEINALFEDIGILKSATESLDMRVAALEKRLHIKA